MTIRCERKISFLKDPTPKYIIIERVFPSKGKIICLLDMFYAFIEELK